MKTFNKRELPENVHTLYVWTHTAFNLKYVGYTKNPDSRKFAHKHPTQNPDTLISKAIAEYGIDAFTYEEIAYGTKKNMKMMEAMLITSLNTVHPNGYNVYVGEARTEETKKKTSKAVKEAKKKKKGVQDWVSTWGSIVKSEGGDNV